MKRLVAVLLMCGSVSSFMGQSIDSVLTYLDSTQHDTLQAKLNSWIGRAYESSSQAVPYLERAIALCEELSRSTDPAVRATADGLLPSTLNFLALNMQRRDDHLRAVALFRRGADLYEQRKDTAGVILIENNLGLLFQKVNDQQRAMEHFHRALSLAQSFHDPMWPASLMARMAALFVEMGELDSAEIYLNESLKDRVNSSLDYRYRNKALLREKQGRLDEALTLLDSSVVVSQREGHALITGSSYLHLARILDHADRPEQAIVALDSCLAHFENGNMVYYCQCLQVRGGIAARLGDHALAERDLTRALAIARDVGQLHTQLLATASLRDLYRRTGRLERAFDMADQWQALDDSVGAMEAKSEMQAMDFAQAMRADSIANVLEKERLRSESEAELSRERTRRNIFLFAGLGVLAFSLVVFHQRNRIRKEHQRSEELLLNILPEEVAEELKANGHADAKHFDQVTILFTDFKGFTEASEKLSPQELVEELNTCFKAFDNIITARGIEKIKTIGDAYMCAGGLPDPKSSSPADVVHAALEMQAFMTSRKKERDALGLSAFAMRVGIHTGPVVAGIVGVKKFQYDIWGDTVNTASRMESSGEVGQVNISEATYALLKDGPDLNFTPRGKVQAKGKGELEMYFVART